MNEPLARIDDILIDDDAIAYATFQSHYQKVISNDRGIFTSRRSVPGSTLYYMTGNRQSLVCFASYDSGETWYDYAAGDEVYPINDAGWHGCYAIGGPRELAADGHIIGTFTEVAHFAKKYYEPHFGKVHFFSIQGGLCRANATSLNF